MQSFSFSTDYLSKWLSISPFKINEITKEDGRLQQLNVQYNFQKFFL
ncbi:ApeA N-terminal domain 1-containing protein [Bacillus sp. FSL W8-0102]